MNYITIWELLWGRKVGGKERWWREADREKRRKRDKLWRLRQLNLKILCAKTPGVRSSIFTLKHVIGQFSLSTEARIIVLWRCMLTSLPGYAGKAVMDNCRLQHTSENVRNACEHVRQASRWVDLKGPGDNSIWGYIVFQWNHIMIKPNMEIWYSYVVLFDRRITSTNSVS